MTKSGNKPTDAELEILQVLWEHGPSTVRQVHEHLVSDPPRGYTTVLKLLQIMSDKGSVRRDESQRAHIYEACQNADQTRQNLVTNLLDRAFDGSAGQLVMHALSTRTATDEEREEIRKILDDMDGKKQ